MNVIYAYKKVSNDKIVYVGQTVNIEERHKTHVDYDPFNQNTKEYNYPLSRGIRKYGKQEYKLIILEENVPKDKLNEREKYWIEYYDTYWNGYNQTIGGSFPVRPTFTNDQIDKVIEMLGDFSYSFQDIINKTGISLTHIYNINIGARRRKEGINYPIRPSNTKGSRGLKFSPEEVVEVHEKILNTNLSFKELGKMFNVSSAAIADINSGRTKAYILEKYNYPLRSNSEMKAVNKTKLSQEQVEEIHLLLLDTNRTFKSIAEQFNVSPAIIGNLNAGRTKSYILKNFKYPIRQ